MIDEQTLSESLHAIESPSAPDLLSRVRRGGQRRLLRRRSYAVVGAAAVGAVAVPAVHTVRGAGHLRGVDAGSRPAASPTSSATGLAAAPPPAGSACDTGTADPVPAATAARLLLLPRGRSVSYAFVRAQRAGCPPPHAALVMLDRSGDQVNRGVVVDGPDAPTAVEAGMAGPGVDFGGVTGDLPVQGQAAEEFTLDGFTDAFWTDPQGAQWHAQVRGMAQPDAVALLDRLQLDAASGTATLPDAAPQGWTVAATPALSDRTVETVESQWEQSGRTVDLTVRAVPDRTDENAALARPNPSFVDVDGHRGVLSVSSQFADLTWAPATGVEAQLLVERGTAADAENAAGDLALTDPTDPRISWR